MPLRVGSGTRSAEPERQGYSDADHPPRRDTLAVAGVTPTILRAGCGR